MESILDKEQTIMCNLMECVNQIQSVNNILHNKSLGKKLEIYKHNFTNVYSELNPLFESIQILPESLNTIKNTRNNYYSYFQKVQKFISDYEPSIQHSLNESMNVDEKMVQNPMQINIFSFKKDLEKLIKILEKQNDFDKLSTEVIKIKAFANKPISIFGYDICNNLSLKIELQEKFGLQESDLISICYEKTENQLYFVSSKIIIVYDVKQDLFDNYNTINKSRLISFENLEPKTYLQTIKDLTFKNCIYELWVNVNKFEIKFTDNLYLDNLRNKVNSEVKAKMSVINK